MKSSLYEHHLRRTGTKLNFWQTGTSANWDAITPKKHISGFYPVFFMFFPGCWSLVSSVDMKSTFFVKPKRPVEVMLQVKRTFRVKRWKLVVCHFWEPTSYQQPGISQYPVYPPIWVSDLPDICCFVHPHTRTPTHTHTHTWGQNDTSEVVDTGCVCRIGPSVCSLCTYLVDPPSNWSGGTRYYPFLGMCRIKSVCNCV